VIRPVLSTLGAASLRAAAWAIAGLLVLAATSAWFIPEVTGPVAEGGWTRRSRAAFMPAGFHPAELDGATGQHYSWTTDSSEIRIPHLSRSRGHVMTLDLRSGRPERVARPAVRILVDDQIRAHAPAPDDGTVRVEIPAGGREGAAIAIQSTPVYHPGGTDPRALGVIIDRVTIAPDGGGFLLSWRVLLVTAFALFLVSLGVLAAGGVTWIAHGAALAAVGGSVWLMVRDAAFLGNFAEDRLLPVCASLAVAGLAVSALATRWPRLAGVPEWGVAAAVVLAAVAVKTALFWHPAAIVGDGFFQVNRATLVHNGELFFTSVTPKPFFEFPYPVALYVAAMPFWDWFPAPLDRLRLLRLASIVAEAIAGILLYLAMRRVRSGRLPAFAAVALWPLARAPFEALSNANLTNHFGQSVFAAAMAGIVWMAASRPGAAGAAAIGLLLTVAFLSHFGTVTVGLALLAAVIAALVLFGRGLVRKTGVLALTATVAAAGLAWGLYYSNPRFLKVYGETYASVAARKTDDSSKMAASPAVKLSRWWTGIGDDYGRPGVGVLLVLAMGLMVLLRARPWAGGDIVVIAWLFSWLALTALGILTPITLRANLAAAPAITIAAALGIAWLASLGRAGQIAALAAAIVVAWDGWSLAVRTMELAR
jgi:hypothetical protein